jgi:hypothetical protein
MLASSMLTWAALPCERCNTSVIFFHCQRGLTVVHDKDGMHGLDCLV